MGTAFIAAGFIVLYLIIGLIVGFCVQWLNYNKGDFRGTITLLYEDSIGANDDYYDENSDIIPPIDPIICWMSLLWPFVLITCILWFAWRGLKWILKQAVKVIYKRIKK